MFSLTNLFKEIIVAIKTYTDSQGYIIRISDTVESIPLGTDSNYLILDFINARRLNFPSRQETYNEENDNFDSYICNNYIIDLGVRILHTNYGALMDAITIKGMIDLHDFNAISAGSLGSTDIENQTHENFLAAGIKQNLYFQLSFNVVLNTSKLVIPRVQEINIDLYNNGLISEIIATQE